MLFGFFIHNSLECFERLLGAPACSMGSDAGYYSSFFLRCLLEVLAAKPFSCFVCVQTAHIKRSRECLGWQIARLGPTTTTFHCFRFCFTHVYVFSATHIVRFVQKSAFALDKAVSAMRQFLAYRTRCLPFVGVEIDVA